MSQSNPLFLALARDHCPNQNIRVLFGLEQDLRSHAQPDIPLRSGKGSVIVHKTPQEGDIARMAGNGAQIDNAARPQPGKVVFFIEKVIV